MYQMGKNPKIQIKYEIEKRKNPIYISLFIIIYILITKIRLIR